MISKINDIFDKIYVVSYKESKMLKTLDKRLEGLEYEIFYGVNMKDISIQDLINKGYTAHGGAARFTPANFACTFSHHYLHKKLKSENQNNVLILEDDVIIIEDAIDNMVKSYEELPENWDVFYLGFSNHNRNWNDYLRNIKNYKSIMYKGGRYKMGDGRLLPLEGTNAYAINNNFLDLALEKQSDPSTMNPIADGLMFYLYYALEFFACIPQVFPQIDNRYNFYNDKN